MFGTRLRSLSGGVAVALTCGLIGLPPTAASASPHVAGGSSSTGVALVVAGPSDSSLSALNVTNNSMRALAPAFDPAGHTYQTTASDDTTAAVTWTPGTVGATVSVKVNGTPQIFMGN